MEQYGSLWSPVAVSDDGKVIAGWGLGFQYYAGWVVRVDTVVVCHRDDDTPKPGHKAEAHTLRVDFPREFNAHLAHGDTVGRCP